VDMKNVFPSSERADYVQQSLSKTVAKIVSIAAASNKVDELASGAMLQPPVASNLKNQPELRLV
jgi:hypothetical protein